MSTADDIRAQLADVTPAQGVYRLVCAIRSIWFVAPTDEQPRRDEAAERVRQAIDASRREVGR